MVQYDTCDQFPNDKFCEVSNHTTGMIRQLAIGVGASSFQSDENIMAI